LIWLERFHRNNPGKSGLKALDVGCGLGDNAAALAQAGFQVTAFDISPTAVNWAQARFADTSIQFEVADIFDLPERWHGQFDVVAETFTIQALKGQMRLEAIKALSRLVKPEGRLVVVCRGRLDDEPFDPPPWPLTPKELSQVEQLGFNALPLESFFDKKEPPQRLFLADYIKDTANAAEIDGKG
jgi:ubiquinone/menaquinone biosynthesis C-methylase UbiE